MCVSQQNQGNLKEWAFFVCILTSLTWPRKSVVAFLAAEGVKAVKGLLRYVAREGWSSALKWAQVRVVGGCFSCPMGLAGLGWKLSSLREAEGEGGRARQSRSWGQWLFRQNSHFSFPPVFLGDCTALEREGHTLGEQETCKNPSASWLEITVGFWQLTVYPVISLRKMGSLNNKC